VAPSPRPGIACESGRMAEPNWSKQSAISQWAAAGAAVAGVAATLWVGRPWEATGPSGAGSTTVTHWPLLLGALYVCGAITAAFLHLRAARTSKESDVRWKTNVGSPSLLKILSAKYGNPQDGYSNKTASVESAIVGNGLSLLVGREALGYPLEGKWKELLVTYSYDGGQPLETRRPEGRRLILPEDPWLVEFIRKAQDDKVSDLAEREGKHQDEIAAVKTELEARINKAHDRPEVARNSSDSSHIARKEHDLCNQAVKPAKRRDVVPPPKVPQTSVHAGEVARRREPAIT
jgi:hypothetical protein